MAEPTAGERFARCLEHVLAHEGGFADHPNDPGGATNMGITRKTLARWRGVSPWWKLPKSAVPGLGRAEAARIYEAGYWQRVRAAELPAGLDLAPFDYAVNSGPVRAVKALQAQLGVKVDGFVGPLTLDALRRKVAAAGAGALIAALCDGRLGFLRRLATFAVFGTGWSRRVAAIRRAALAMAGAKDLPSTTRTSDMNLLSGYKTYIIAGIMLLTGLAGLLGIPVPALDGHAPASLVMEALAFIFLRQGLKSDVRNS
ncbi:MAG TPA: glycosyl hydrolase 108 family protein [Devosia sp.]|jgi:lysozyme family protein|nr:glycosyl hydrolase 108 family protein [Devosia sp.]